MNSILEQFARQWLKENLAKLPEAWVKNFKLMYANDYHAPIDEVVDEVPIDRLSWAMEQVENSLKKLSQGESHDRPRT